MSKRADDSTVHFEATSRPRRRREAAISVNLTPAIDITFLLLIFFVVSTRFAAVEGSLPSRLPKEQGVLEIAPLPISPIRVRLNQAADGYRLAVDNWRAQPTSFLELTRILENIQSRPGFDAETPVIILAEDDVSWDDVTNCYNAVRRVGVTPGIDGVMPFRNISFGARRPGVGLNLTAPPFDGGVNAVEVRVQHLPVIFATLLVVAPPAAPESTRLPNDKFRRELQRRGLNDLLDYYLRTQPGGDDISSRLLQRDLRLERYSDPTLPAGQRLQAARQASDILRQLLRDHPDSDQALEWRLNLGRDLIDRQAEPYYNNILFRRGSLEDRQQLEAITAEALRIYDQLIQEVQHDIDAVDHMPARDFERLARSGQLDRLELILPKARYFKMWAAFYRCLALPPSTRERRPRLREIVKYLRDESSLTETPHGISHYQAQSLLLAGMASRLLGDEDTAESMLSKAARVVESLPDEMERLQLRWVLTLVTLERVRNHRDAGHYDQAMQVLVRNRAQLGAEEDDGLGITLALALLEGTVHAAHADSLPASQRRKRDQLQLQAREPLLELARRHPRYRNEVYRLVFEQLDDIGDPERMDSFEKNVYVARQLQRAAELRARRLQAERDGQDRQAAALQAEQQDALSTAIVVARALLADGSPLARELRPETRFNLAVCYHERGNTLDALVQFNRVVREDPQFERAETAARYAVRLAELSYSRARPAERDRVRPEFLTALDNAISTIPDSPDLGDYLFTYGQILQDDARFAEAAQRYEALPEEHPQYGNALFLAASCRLQVLRAAVANHDEGPASVLARETTAAVSRFLEWSESSPATADRGEAVLMSCEAELLDPLGKPAKAIAQLDRFDNEGGDQRALLGRAMRLRILAYQAAGDSEKAAAILPGYVQRDPRGAGATLQGLLETLSEEVDRAEAAGRSDEARLKAIDALAVAQELWRWAEQQAETLDDSTRLSLRLSLGEALLRTWRESDLLEAHTLFEGLSMSPEAPGDTPLDARALLGVAEALFRLKRYEQALPYFNRVYRALPEDSERWWQALLRDVQCRHRLDQDPKMLYNLIEQKKALFKHMGGPGMRRQFQALQVELRGTSRRKASTP